MKNNIIVAMVLSVCLIIIAGHWSWHQNLQLEAAYAADLLMETEQRVYRLEPKEQPNYSILHKLVEHYEGQLSDALLFYQEEINQLVIQAEEEYYRKVMNAKSDFRDLVFHYADEADEIRRNKEREFLAICDQYSIELLRNGFSAEDVVLYHFIFEQTAMNLQMKLVTEIISFQK